MPLWRAERQPYLCVLSAFLSSVVYVDKTLFDKFLNLKCLSRNLWMNSFQVCNLLAELTCVGRSDLPLQTRQLRNLHY